MGAAAGGAVGVVFKAGRARGPGLNDAQLVVDDRYLHHGDRIARTPDSPLDPESLAALAAGCPGRIVAIEAVWDGDTVHDWFANLLAVTADPTGERPADRAGRALATRLSVPFHFTSPGKPDDEAPRRRP